MYSLLNMVGYPSGKATGNFFTTCRQIQHETNTVNTSRVSYAREPNFPPCYVELQGHLRTNYMLSG